MIFKCDWQLSWLSYLADKEDIYHLPAALHYKSCSMKCIIDQLLAFELGGGVDLKNISFSLPPH